MSVAGERVALVTGGTDGIGRAVALQLARGGDRVRVVGPVLLRLMAQSPEVAAQTPVFLAQDAQAIGTGGRFYGPRLKQRPVPARAQRPERRSGLWAASEDLVRPYLLEAVAQY